MDRGLRQGVRLTLLSTLPRVNPRLASLAIYFGQPVLKAFDSSFFKMNGFFRLLSGLLVSIRLARTSLPKKKPMQRQTFFGCD